MLMVMRLNGWINRMQSAEKPMCFGTLSPLQKSSGWQRMYLYSWSPQLLRQRTSYIFPARKWASFKWREVFRYSSHSPQS